MKGISRKSALALVACAVAGWCGAAENAAVPDEQLPPAEGWSPVGFAFAPVRQLEWPGPDFDVKGLRLAVFAAHNREVGGIDLAGCGCWADGDMDGLVVSGLANWSDGAEFGVHFASIMNYAEDTMNGVQLATVNSACEVNGVQIGVINCVSDGAGVQLGLWNLAESWQGLQLGLINMAMSYDGIQIGLGNIIGESPLTACVIANAWF